MQVLVDAIQNMVPQVWEAGLRQQMIEGWARIFEAVIFLASIGLGIWVRKEGYKEDEGFMVALGYGIMAVGALIIIVFIESALSHFLCPEYQIIQDLVPNG